MLGEHGSVYALFLAVSSAVASSGCVRSDALAPKVAVVGRAETVAERDARILVLTCVLANRGDGDLRIGPVSTSCGCSSAVISRELVPPGETAEVTVEGHPPPVGARPVRIQITTNDLTEPRLIVEWNLIGRPNPPQLLTPEPAVDMGILRSGEAPPTQTVLFEVLEARDTPTIVRVADDDQGFLGIEGGMTADKAAEDPSFVIRSFRYQIGLLGTPADGAFIRRIEVLRDPIDTAPWLSIPVRGIVRPVARAVPAFVQFTGRRADGKMSARLMIVSDDHSAPLAAECVDHDANTTVLAVEREADRIWFKVERTGGEEDRIARPLIFRVDQPVQAAVDVPVVASTPKFSEVLP